MYVETECQGGLLCVGCGETGTGTRPGAATVTHITSAEQQTWTVGLKPLFHQYGSTLKSGHGEILILSIVSIEAQYHIFQ